jgi:hypothetical protein
MDFAKDFVDSLEPEYQNLFNDIIKIAITYLIFKYLGKSMLSDKNPFTNMKMIDELIQIFILSVAIYHLIVKKFVL